MELKNGPPPAPGKAEHHPSGGHIENVALAKLGDFTTDRRVLVVIAMGIVVGVCSTFVGVGLLRLIQLVTNIAYFGRLRFTFPVFSHSPLGLGMIAIPVIGSLIVGLMARYGTDKIRGHGIPEALEAILLGRSRLDVKVAILKPLSSAIAIGTGGPFGAEGPIIMTGGAIGSLIAQAMPVSDAERKTLLVAGACAGMTTVFGTPIASMMLAVELMLFEWTPASFLPVAAACIIANILRDWMGLAAPLFPFIGGMPISFMGLGSWILVGLAGGILSGILTQLVYGFEDGYMKLPFHWMWWPLLGGLVVGIGGQIDPQALGVGYAHIAAMLRGHVLPMAALLLLVVKALIWSCALSSGTSGGILAPLIMIGGAMGAAAQGVLPAASPGFWALLAMGATMGGTMRSPFTATFFMVEVTGNTSVLFPLIVACVTAHAATVLMLKRSILTEKVARRGHHLTREYHTDPFALTQVQDVMVANVAAVPGTMTLHEVSNFLADSKTKHPSFPVTDAESHVLGIVDPPTVLGWRHAGKHRDAPLSELFAGQPVGAVTYPDEYLETLVERMMEANVAHMPVVSREDAKLVGYIAWKDLLRVRTKQREEEKVRVVFYRVR